MCSTRWIPRTRGRSSAGSSPRSSGGRGSTPGLASGLRRGDLGVDRDAHLVTGRVPELVVDVLEPVEVKHEQRARRVVAARVRKLGAVGAVEPAPVQQPGELVVIGVVLKLVLAVAPVGDVLDVGED